MLNAVWIAVLTGVFAATAMADDMADRQPARGLKDVLSKDRRVLVVVAPAENDPMFVEQRRDDSIHRAAYAERDIRLIYVVGQTVTINGVAAADGTASRLRDDLKATGFTVVLFGKDGGEKLRNRQPISAVRIIELIDSMPMRQRETGRR